MSDLNYDENYFMTANPNIYENSRLREPQIRGYYKAFEHFVINAKKTHAIIVLPTGVGKTGLIGLLPYHICKGRALVITPQLTIKDTVIDSLDPDKPENFWYKRDIFQKISELPTLVEYAPAINREVLDAANMVVLNIHKLQARLESSPLKFLPEDYFDMIIIDEAHHSTADTWVSTTEYFSKAKVVKLTGTPIRTDGVELAGELVYKYKLSQAMARGYIKSLRNFVYIPEQLYLTLDNDPAIKYTPEDLLKLGLRDEDWIRRSVAYSRECSESVVKKSIELLEEKRKNGSKVPHKIIAVACSISHAEQIKTLYSQNGYRAEVIHSKQDFGVQKDIKKAIENHRLEVIIHVAMLGEGYDHPYLSIAAIFRPFKNALPYEQFIGRILRVIPENEAEKSDDNIADVISHKNLELTRLWEKYKIELQESEVIKHLQDENIIEEAVAEACSGKQIGNILPMGQAYEQGDGVLSEDIYLNTELLEKHREEEEKQRKAISELQKLLNIEYEQALSIYNQTRTQETAAMLKRPDLYFANKKKNLDESIREDIVPELITKFKINQSSNNLSGCRLFTGKYRWIKNSNNSNPNNGALLAMYLNSYMRNEIGKPRQEWTLSDYDNAFQKLSVVKEYMERVLSDYLKMDLD